MDERKRLITLLKYLIEHNEEHREELLKLSEGGFGTEDEIKKAASSLLDVNRHLKKALEILEGEDEDNKTGERGSIKH